MILAIALCVAGAQPAPEAAAPPPLVVADKPLLDHHARDADWLQVSDIVLVRGRDLGADG